MRNSIAVEISRVTQRALYHISDLRSDGGLTVMYNIYRVDAMTPSILSRVTALFRNMLRRYRIRGANEPIRMIDLRLPAHQLPLPRLIGPSPAHQIPVLLRLKHGYEMYARPHLLPSQFILLPDPLAGLVESVGADDAHGEEVVGRAETARGDVALVLYGLVAAGWREVLRHG